MTPDTLIQTMSDSMPRDTFERILRNQNLYENEQLDKENKFLNLRLVINGLNKRFLNFSFNGENKTTDESTISYYKTHSDRQRINNKPIRVGYNIWVLAETYGYVVQFGPNQGVKKEKQVASSFKWKKIIKTKFTFLEILMSISY